MDGTITLFLLLSSVFPYSLSCFFISLFSTQKESNDLGRPFLSYSFSCTLCLFCGFGCLVREAFWFGGFIIAYVRCVLWDCVMEGFEVGGTEVPRFGSNERERECVCR